MTSPEELVIIEKEARENCHLLDPCYLRIAIIHMKRLNECIDTLEDDNANEHRRVRCHP